ncbi:TraB/GumN family protein [Kiloniella laminariae]|uniref:TraB/GumN family protein n=1 Tax=Kiloniella laminariae TaxID=454162 RepID=A0ABT4LMX2_9PROT|nr:TraB/GumN family protein [Kiloniella laminariae]MCZ4282240.1 TraB/GumN family protein [Kiloniella laminariae]
MLKKPSRIHSASLSYAPRSLKLVWNRILLLSLMPVFLVITQLAQAQELPFGRGLMWQVSKEGVEPSIIYGTFHSSERRVVDSSASAHRKLLTAKSLVIEVEDDDAIQQRLFETMVYDDGRRLDQLVSPETFEKIKVLGYEYGFLARQMNVLRPWAAGVMFSFPPSEASRISLGIRTLDQSLQDLARKQEIEIIALETIQEQLLALQGEGEEEQILLLTSLPETIQEVEDDFEDLVGDYLSQNVAGLYARKRQSLAVLPPEKADAYIHRLVTSRNYSMVERMRGMLNKGNVFVAVDALHLPGHEGILSLLQAQGYRIEPVK